MNASRHDSAHYRLDGQVAVITGRVRESACHGFLKPFRAQ
jgi:hypothetical protein